MIPKTKITRLKRGSKAYKQLQADVNERDGYECQCCGYPAHGEPHHALAVGKGGSDVMENMVAICNEADRCIRNDISISCHTALHHSNPEIVLRRMRRKYPNFDDLCDGETRPVRMIRAALLNIVRGK